VDEHAEAGLAPPLHAGVALGWGFGVLDGGDGVIDGLGVWLAAFELRVAYGAGNEKECGSDAAVSDFQGSSLGRNTGTGIIGENIRLPVQIEKMPLTGCRGLSSCVQKTESLTRIYTDETDLRTGKSKNDDEIQGSFTSFRMTDVKETTPKTVNGSF
jgi:hypothetical protein